MTTSTPPFVECEQTHAGLAVADISAAVDLAKHKRMSVSSCLEEMLVHTNEGVGPHTQTTVTG